MKSNPSNENDPLSNALREWKVDTALPLRFPERVWQRIARAEALRVNRARFGGWKWFDAMLARRGMAVSYVVIWLLIGVSVGVWQARHQAARLEDDLEARYLQTVDPYLASR